MGLELFSGLIGAIIGSVLSNNVQKMNELDSKSGWRSKLFDLASKDKMTIADIYLLRATLRFDKHDEPTTIYSFKFMSNQITEFCESMIVYYDKTEQELCSKYRYISDPYDREKIRIYARYLLKNHWEVFSRKIFFFSNEFKLKNEHEIGKRTIEMIEKVTADQMKDINDQKKLSKNIQNKENYK